MELFEMIRRGHAAGETIRQLAKKHDVHRRMVRQALDSAIPPNAESHGENNRSWVRLRSSSTGFSTRINRRRANSGIPRIASG